MRWCHKICTPTSLAKRLSEVKKWNTRLKTVPTGCQVRQKGNLLASFPASLFLLPKILFFGAEKFPLEKDVSRREGREERRLPCWPINQSVINVVVTIPVSWILNTYLSGIKLLERTKRQVYFKKLKKILGLFLDLPWHLPSLPTTTGCPQDSDWVRRVDCFLRMLCMWC